MHDKHPQPPRVQTSGRDVCSSEHLELNVLCVVDTAHLYFVQSNLQSYNLLTPSTQLLEKYFPQCHLQQPFECLGFAK